MGRTVRIECCGLCGDPIKTDDTFGVPRAVGRIEGLCVEIGFSRGGWGRRNFGEGAKVRFSDEVCGECYDQAQTVLQPVVEFIRGGGRRGVDNVQPMRDDELPPGGRPPPVLRALSFLRGKG